MPPLPLDLFDHPAGGWIAFVLLVLALLWAFWRRKLIPEAQHLEIVRMATDAGKDIATQFDRLQETHKLTTAQNGELMETARFNRAVMQAVEQTQARIRGGEPA